MQGEMAGSKAGVSNVVTPPVVVWLPFNAQQNAQQNAQRLSPEYAMYQWVNSLQTLLEVALADNCLVVHLDSSSDLIEEFIASRPDNLRTMHTLAERGLLWVGPWFTAPTSIWASGEALVRNLLMGRLWAQRLQIPVQTCVLFPSAVYMSQIPQLLAGFGIHTAAISLPPTQWLNVISPLAACQWQGIDGSELVLLPLREVPLGHMQHIGDLSPSPLLCDATTCHYDVDCLSTLHSVSLDTLVKKAATHYSMSDKSGATPAPCSPTPWTQGEIEPRTTSYVNVFPKLRYAAWQAQNMLEKWAEPWAAAAWLCGHTYPQHFITKAWKYLLLNQGCEVTECGINDATYRHMYVRTEQAHHLARAIYQDALTKMAESVHYPHATLTTSSQGFPLWVINPSGWVRQEMVTTQVTMPGDTQHLELLTNTGQPIAYQLHHAEPVSTQPMPSADGSARRFTISFCVPETPATGFRRLQVQPASHRPYFMGESIAAGTVLENRNLKVTVKTNGALRLEDKRTGQVYDNCNVFEDGGDVGTYMAYKAPDQDRLITTYAAHPHVSIIENGMLVGTIQVHHELNLPLELHPYGDRRSDQRATCDIISFITLHQGADRVEIHTRVENRCKDHRLRVLFTTGIPAAMCRVIQPYAVIEQATGMTNRGMVMSEYGTQPKLEFIDISEKQSGLLVASRGLCEYEIKPTPAGTIALTLLRAINNGERYGTASMQALDSLEFDYALIPHAGQWEEATRSAWGFCSPLQAFTPEHRTDPSRTMQEGLMYFSLVALEPAPLMLTAVKRSEDGEALIVRACNPTARSIQACFTTMLPMQTAWLAQLDESPLQPLLCNDPHHIYITCHPYQVITLRLTLSPSR